MLHVMPRVDNLKWRVDCVHHIQNKVKIAHTSMGINLLVAQEGGNFLAS
jgi:hypothetical protein